MDLLDPSEMKTGEECLSNDGSHSEGNRVHEGCGDNVGNQTADEGPHQEYGQTAEARPVASSFSQMLQRSPYRGSEWLLLYEENLRVLHVVILVVS